MRSDHSRADQLESGVHIGDFEIEKRLGAGGMGIVYQARQISLNRRVALKVLGPALTQDTGIARFQREAQAVARLKHPNIAGLHFLGQDGDLVYHVMELIEGISLRAVLDRLANTHNDLTTLDTVVSAELSAQQPAPAVRFDQVTSDQVTVTPIPDVPALTPSARKTRASTAYIRRCCEIVRDVANALAYAHKEGVVHRDIKPENLMLDAKGQIHIIDFGLARFFDDISITNTGQLVGTPLYMSPEQVTGRIKADHRSDIYSLGMVLYEMLTLRAPIHFTSRENLLRNIVAKSLPPLSARNSSVSQSLEAIIHKSLHKDPEERYQSAAAFADDLDRFLRGKAVTAPPYHFRLDDRELAASRPGVVILSAFLCFLAGFVGFGVLLAVGVMTLAITGLGEFTPTLMTCAQCLVGFTLFFGTALLSRGLLAGWNWARWVVIVLAGILCLACLVGGTGLVFMALSSLGTANPRVGPGATNEPPMSRFILGMALMYSVPVLLTLVCAVTTIVSLLLPDTRVWFRFVAQTRREHRELLRAMSD